MARSNDECARIFFNGGVFGKNNMTTDGDTVWSYGAHFPIAIRDSVVNREGGHHGMIWVNEDRYSATTSKHRAALVRELQSHSLYPTDETRTDLHAGGYTFRLYAHWSLSAGGRAKH